MAVLLEERGPLTVVPRGPLDLTGQWSSSRVTMGFVAAGTTRVSEPLAGSDDGYANTESESHRPRRGWPRAHHPEGQNSRRHRQGGF